MFNLENGRNFFSYFNLKILYYFYSIFKGELLIKTHKSYKYFASNQNLVF